MGDLEAGRAVYGSVNPGHLRSQVEGMNIQRKDTKQTLCPPTPAELFITAMSVCLEQDKDWPNTQLLVIKRCRHTQKQSEKQQ